MRSRHPSALAHCAETVGNNRHAAVLQPRRGSSTAICPSKHPSRDATSKLAGKVDQMCCDIGQRRVVPIGIMTPMLFKFAKMPTTACAAEQVNATARRVSTRLRPGVASHAPTHGHDHWLHVRHEAPLNAIRLRAPRVRHRPFLLGQTLAPRAEEHCAMLLPILPIVPVPRLTAVQRPMWRTTFILDVRLLRMSNASSNPMPRYGRSGRRRSDAIFAIDAHGS